jgi:hypothetical protein
VEETTDFVARACQLQAVVGRVVVLGGSGSDAFELGIAQLLCRNLSQCAAGTVERGASEDISLRVRPTALGTEVPLTLSVEQPVLPTIFDLKVPRVESSSQHPCNR